MQRRVLFVLTVSLCSVALPLRAQPSEKAQTAALTEADIAERTAALLSGELPEEVRAPLEQAKLGLSRAAAAGKAGDEGERQRAIDLARAALSLAEARAALLRERALLAATTRRGEQAVRRNEASKALLAKAKARLREAPAADARP